MGYIIDRVSVDAKGGGPDSEIIICELALKDDQGQISYHILEEIDGCPSFLSAKTSCIEGLIEGREEAFQALIQEEEEALLDYEAVFDQEIPEEKLNLYRYLIYMVRSDWDDIDAFRQATLGQELLDIMVPDSDLEEIYRGDYDMFLGDDDDYGIPEDKESLYRLLLSIETDHGLPSIFHDTDKEGFEEEQTQIDALHEAVEDEEDYENWKEEFLNQAYETCDPAAYLTCHYTFAGAGSYYMTILSEELDQFKSWLDSSDNATLTSYKAANEQEIRQYLAITAYDEEEE